MDKHNRRNVLVTGANSYIGSAVCRAIVRAGWNTCDLIRNPRAKKEPALSEIIPVVGSFTNLGFLEPLFALVKTFDVIQGEVTANGYGLSCCGRRAAYLEDSPLNGKECTVNSVKVFHYTDLFDAAVVKPTCVFGYSSSYYGTIFDYADAQRTDHSQVLRAPGDANSAMHAAQMDDCGNAFVSLVEHQERGAVTNQPFNISSHRYEILNKIEKSVTKEYGFKKGAHFVPTNEVDPSFPQGVHFVLSFSQWVRSDKLWSLTGWVRRDLFSKNDICT